MDKPIHKANTNPSREKLFLLWNSIQRILPDLNAEDTKLTEDHENRIRRHFNQLINNLNVPDVVTQMFQSEKLTAREHEHLRQFNSTPIKASEELLNIVIRSSLDVYECFLESLKKTKQHHVHQMLTSDVESACIDDQSMFEHPRIIRQNFDWLTENLDLDSGLLTNLYAAEVLSRREYCQLDVEKDRFVKNELFLSIISRKSIEDFKKFKIALNDNSQCHITKKLTDTSVGDANENVTTTVEKTFTVACSASFERRIPPKPPPKPKKQLTILPESKLMVIKTKPVLEASIQPSKPSRIDRRKNRTKHEVVKSPDCEPTSAINYLALDTGRRQKKQRVEYLEEHFMELPNELQTEVSAKIFLMHQINSTDDIIWRISSTKIIEELRHVKRQNIGLLQVKAAEENSESLVQEVSQREHECRMIKEGTQREKTRSKKELREMQERLLELQDRLDLTQNAEKILLKKLMNKEVEVKTLKALNTQQGKAANEKVSIIEKLEGHKTFFEMKFMEIEASLRGTEDGLIESDLELEGNTSTARLEEVREILNEMEVNKDESEAKPIFALRDIDDVTTEESEAKSIFALKDIDDVTTEDSAPWNFDQNLEDDRKLWEGETEEIIRQIHTLQKESFDSRERCLKLQQELQLERAEKYRLSKQEEQYRKLIADLRYKSDPVLVQTIRSKATDGRKRSIFGMTILNKELFAVSWESSKVDVYDSIQLSLIRQWNLKELVGPLDIGSCKTNRCLYIFDSKSRSGQPKEILRVDPNGELICKWSTGTDWGYGLSVTYKSNVLATVSNKDLLKEYSPDGQLIREINLSTLAGIHHPFHAIKLTSGHFLVSNGDFGDDLHRVCIVDENGSLKKSFGGKRGSTKGQLMHPFYLSVDGSGFVLVADQRNNRVLLLDSDLEFKREILPREGGHILRLPTKILLDESNGRLFVFDNEPDSPKILIFDT